MTRRNFLSLASTSRRTPSMETIGVIREKGPRLAQEQALKTDLYCHRSLYFVQRETL